LRRKLKTDEVERIPRDDPYADLRRKCARFAADNFDDLTKAKPTRPIGLNNDRAADNWEPLLAIAEACGCQAEAREAALELSGVDDDETDAIVLLADLKTVFERARPGDNKTVTVSSAAIAADLASNGRQALARVQIRQTDHTGADRGLVKTFQHNATESAIRRRRRKTAGTGLSG
jgi:hypothetical protein